jgi:hypothetical protein
MKDEHGETDNRLYARPAIQDARVEAHPAIATDQSADIYDPSGTTRTDWIGEDTAKQRIFVAQGETTSRQKEATRRYYSAQNLIARAERRAEAEVNRRKAVADYEGGMSLGRTAQKYSVNPRTIISWAASFRPADALPRRPDRSKTEKIVIDYTDANTGVGLAQGTGGSMSDAHVRFATRRLEKAIIALQRKRMMPTFTYAKEA